MIKYDDTYMIDSDDSQWILLKDSHKVDKNGTPIRKALGYYGTLEGAIKALFGYLVRKKMGECDYTLTDAILKIEKIKLDFDIKIQSAIDGDL